VSHCAVLFHGEENENEHFPSFVSLYPVVSPSRGRCRQTNMSHAKRAALLSDDGEEAVDEEITLAGPASHCKN
jgi:hypothetical protein